jgi:uncharacterized protein
MGNQAVDTLFYNADDPAERYSAVDTIRARAIYLTTGSRLLSPARAMMATIVADTCGRHDTLGGACAAESNQVRYALEKRPMHNCRDNYLLALAESSYDMGKRDLTSNINFFMNVPVTPEGRPDLRGRHLGGGQVRGAARRDGPDRPGLQLPAAQQPLQRLQPDAGADADWD